MVIAKTSSLQPCSLKLVFHWMDSEREQRGGYCLIQNYRPDIVIGFPLNKRRQNIKRRNDEFFTEEK